MPCPAPPVNRPGQDSRRWDSEKSPDPVPASRAGLDENVLSLHLRHMRGRRQFRAIVRGRVQGVSFRAATVREAKSLGLDGYAKNLKDGTVEVVARGDEELLQKLIEFLHQGPPAAQVSEVIVDWSDAGPVQRGFVLRWW
jgi:acylphosphatase